MLPMQWRRHGGGGKRRQLPPLTLARLDPEIIENPSRNFSGRGVWVDVYRVRFYFQIGDKLITELQGRFADEQYCQCTG